MPLRAHLLDMFDFSSDVLLGVSELLGCHQRVLSKLVDPRSRNTSWRDSTKFQIDIIEVH